MRLIRLRRHHVAQGSDSPLLRYSTALAIVRKASDYHYKPLWFRTRAESHPYLSPESSWFGHRLLTFVLQLVYYYYHDEKGPKRLIT